MEEKTPDQIRRELAKAFKKSEMELQRAQGSSKMHPSRITRRIIFEAYKRHEAAKSALSVHDEKYKIDKP
jgi:hypothetical protein